MDYWKSMLLIFRYENPGFFKIFSGTRPPITPPYLKYVRKNSYQACCSFLVCACVFPGVFRVISWCNALLTPLLFTTFAMFSNTTVLSDFLICEESMTATIKQQNYQAAQLDECSKFPWDLHDQLFEDIVFVWFSFYIIVNMAQIESLSFSKNVVVESSFIFISALSVLVTTLCPGASVLHVFFSFFCMNLPLGKKVPPGLRPRQLSTLGQVLVMLASNKS